MKTSLLFAATAAALSLASVPASAATTMFVYNGSTSGMTDLMSGFNDQATSTVNGVVLSTTGSSGLKKKGNGLSDLTISLADPTLGFSDLVIGLNATKGSPVVITGFATLLDGSSVTLDPFSYDYGALGGGSSNLFNIRDTEGSLFTSLTLQFSTNTSQIKSLYAGGIDALPTVSAVPEPASWAMMIGGFGLIGAAMRRRNTRTKVQFNYA